MNAQVKTVLLTILTLSALAIALVELSGVSSTALFNKYGIGKGGHGKTAAEEAEEEQRTRQAVTMPKTRMEFTDTLHHFGKIKEGDKAAYAFRFKNTGDAPLLIIKAQPSCGCTVPVIPKAPVPPGGEGEILVEFDSHNRKGHQKKSVMIFSNAVLDRMPIGFDVDVE